MITILLFFVLFLVQYTSGQRKYIVATESQNDFSTTVDLLYKTLNEKKITIFADFDHHKNAQNVEIKMPKSRVIVFGNPKAGTHLMLENPEIAIELPLKIAIVETDEGLVKILYNNTLEYTSEYKIKNTKLLDNIQKLMEGIVKQISKKK